MKYKLKDIAKINMGQSPKSDSFNSEGKGTPFLQGNRSFGFKYPTIDTFTINVTKIAKQGEVLLSVRAPVGDINIAPSEICIGRGLCAIDMNNGNNEFLYYLLKCYVPLLMKKENGTVFGSINKNDICNFEIHIPSGINKQNKIARILAELDKKIEINNTINKNLVA